MKCRTAASLRSGRADANACNDRAGAGVSVVDQVPVCEGVEQLTSCSGRSGDSV